eukprot:g2105.t1
MRIVIDAGSNAGAADVDDDADARNDRTTDALCAGACDINFATSTDCRSNVSNSAASSLHANTDWGTNVSVAQECKDRVGVLSQILAETVVSRQSSANSETFSSEAGIDIAARTASDAADVTAGVICSGWLQQKPRSAAVGIGKLRGRKWKRRWATLGTHTDANAALSSDRRGAAVGSTAFSHETLVELRLYRSMSESIFGKVPLDEALAIPLGSVHDLVERAEPKYRGRRFDLIVDDFGVVNTNNEPASHHASGNSGSGIDGQGWYSRFPGAQKQFGLQPHELPNGTTSVPEADTPNGIEDTGASVGYAWRKRAICFRAADAEDGTRWLTAIRAAMNTKATACSAASTADTTGAGVASSSPVLAVAYEQEASAKARVQTVAENETSDVALAFELWHVNESQASLGFMPRVIAAMSRYGEGFGTEGLYRVSGSRRRVRALYDAFCESNEDALLSNETVSDGGDDRDDKECQNCSSSCYADPLLLASVVKLWLCRRSRRLVDDGGTLSGKFVQVGARVKSQQQTAEEVQGCAHLLRELVQLLPQVNRMSALALSVCLAPTFFPEPHKARDDLVSVQTWFSHAAAALRLMIEHHSEVFGQ